jgi:hypothetical protein
VGALSNTGGYANTANGEVALFSNTIGYANTANGHGALYSNTTGVGNVAVGEVALANITGSHNIALGDAAGSSLVLGDNNIYIGHPGGSDAEFGVTRIGFEQNAAFIAGIYGATTGGPAIPVVIDSSGQLGTVSSSRRFKQDITPMEKSSEAILALKPVTFHYKTDKTTTPQFGLIAEQVAQVNPDLVIYDHDGKPYTVRYEAVNAMLLNEFLKEHKAFVTQQHNVEKLQAAVAQQEKQIDVLTAGLRKVSAQLELNKTAPQTVANSR